MQSVKLMKPYTVVYSYSTTSSGVGFWWGSNCKFKL